MPHGVIQKFLAGDGGYIRKLFLIRIYTQKAAPGLHKGQKQKIQKHVAFAAKKGVIHEGGYTRGLYMRDYSTML